MATTYEPISSTTLSGATGSITFSSIPSTYTDLVIAYTGTNDVGVLHRIRFNGDTGANYSCTMVEAYPGAGMLASVYTESWIYNLPAITAYNAVVNIPHYTNTSMKKTYLSDFSCVNSSASPNKTIGIWNDTSAITSITISTSSYNFNAGSTFTLFGIKAA